VTTPAMGPAANVIVLDSWALLAYLNEEPAAQQVRQVLRRARRHEILALISIMNFGECLYTLERRVGREHTLEVAGHIDQLPIEVVLADRKLVFEAAHLKANYPVSYADAFAAALAMRHRARLMTGDLEFKALEKEVAIHWLR